MQTKLQALRVSIGGPKRGWSRFTSPHRRRVIRTAMLCGYLVREFIYRGRDVEKQKAELLRKLQNLKA